MIPFGQLASRISGQLDTGDTLRRLYATDASEYQEMPAGVVFPKDDKDLREIIRFARRNKLGLIPRTAGTSLAGQCVGDGLVVDVSRHFHRILVSMPSPAACASSRAWCAMSSITFLSPTGCSLVPRPRPRTVP